MAGIFDGLEKFGLTGFSEARLFEPANGKEKDKKEVKPFNIKDYIYWKEFTCPVCSKAFGANVARMGKVRLITIETNLHPVYEPVDPMFYDVIICEKCGYGAVKQQFSHITESQIESVGGQLGAKYRPVAYPDELTVDMAIERYKLVLLNALIKKAGAGEKAYICMKLSWLYHMKEDRDNELLFIRQAYDGFIKAYGEERPPIMGIEEDTIIYLLGSFSKELALYDDSLRFLGKIIVSKTVSKRLKEKARDLKDEILSLKKA